MDDDPTVTHGDTTSEPGPPESGFREPPSPAGGDDGLLGIGELAARTRLSHKALRLYGERGLLPPAAVDPRTGFRRYAPGQVERARRIALLRGIGMPLARIAEVLGPDAGPAVTAGPGAAARLDAYWREREAEHTALRTAVAHARHVLAGGTASPVHTIAEREVPARKVVVTQRHVTAAALPGFLAEGAELLLAHLRAAGACLSAPLFAVYHGLVDADSAAPVEVCAPTEAPVGPAERIGVRIEPAYREAYTSLTRRPEGYAAMAAAHDAVAAWITAHGHRPAGSGREIYAPPGADGGCGAPAVDVAYPFLPGTGPRP